MEYSVKQAYSILEAEFVEHPYTIKEALGNAAVDRKVRNLIFACINEGLSESDCNSYLNSIINANPFKGVDIVSIRNLVKLYYAAKRLLDSGAYEFR